jgi:hypothetical protein
MDWLLGRQGHIEAELPRRHLRSGGIAMFDLFLLLGRGDTLRAGRPRLLPGRDGKKGRAQIEYGLLTDPEGRPVAIRVFAGNTADPAALSHAVETIRGTFEPLPRRAGLPVHQGRRPGTCGPSTTGWRTGSAATC